jgi:hypothetical protein
MNKTDNPKPDEKICYNCRYFSSCIGVGQGLRCGHQNQWGMLIPAMRHTCSYFECRIINQQGENRNANK